MRVFTFLIALILTLATSPLAAATFFVRSAGNDQADGLTPATAFASPLRAVQALNHGDSIVIGPGTYKSAAMLGERFGLPDAPITITGDETGQQTGDAPGPVVLEPATAGAPTVHLVRVRNTVLAGLTFRGGEGLRVEQSREVRVERCTFDQASRGLSSDATVGLRIESSVFSRNVVALFLQGSSKIRLAHTSVAGSSAAGLLVLRCGEGSIRNSLFAENNSAYVLDPTSAALWSSDHNVIAGTVGPWGKAPLASNIYEWFAASDQERHSGYVLPAFVDPAKYDLRIDPTISWSGGLPGMFAGTKLDEPVKLDRAGLPLERPDGSAGVGAFAYPAPVAQANWRKIEAPLDPAKPRVSAAVFTEDGTLVRTLLADEAGVREIWWDGLDDQGQPAPAGKYQLRQISHDLRVVDDGNVGDNGNAKGAYHPDAANRFALLPDGAYIVACEYDEAGFPIRLYAPSGQPVFASNLAEKEIIAITASGSDVYAVIGKPQSKLVKLKLPGERVVFANGADSLPLFFHGDAAAGVSGLVVDGDRAFVALPGLDLVRSIDIKSGNKLADWPVPGVADLSRDEAGGLWAISGADIVRIDITTGQITQRFNSTLAKPMYLSANKGRVAVVDRENAKLLILDSSNGNVVKSFGQPVAPATFAKVSLDKLRDPRGVAYLPDGKLLLAEQARVRCFWPETGAIAYESVSNFMETAVVHPTDPAIVYCGLGVYRVDPKTGAWAWVAEGAEIEKDKDGQKIKVPLGSPNQAVVLGGKPFVSYHAPDSHSMIFDVTDPLNPRLAGTFDIKNPLMNQWSYATWCFGKDGNLVLSGPNYTLQFTIIPFKGLDGSGNPIFDFANPVPIGSEKDALSRGLQNAAGIVADRVNGDLYFLAVTEKFKKMVPGWGADGTGVGKVTADGLPKWFALSSGGNYMSVSAANDGKQTLVLAGKSFGGQLDVFDADGLRLATGNWNWATNYHIGFVDLRYGVHAYVRPDGKIGAYVEDDAIGRFGRARIDGSDTIAKQIAPFDHTGAAAPALADPPLTSKVSGTSLERVVPIRKISPIPVDGNWETLAAAGVTPQILTLPSSVSFARNVPGDLMSDFREGTLIGAVAHDGANLYTYFLVTDATMNFDSPTSNSVWMYDGVELWIEEDQFGLSFTADGTPVAHKFRHHSKAGKPFEANYALPREAIFAQKIDDLSQHPLAKQLESATGTTLAGKAGYVVMAKIAFEDIKLVGGIAGRAGGSVSPLTGQAGELVRIGLALGAVSGKGREQDYKVNWPASLMFADPTRSTVFRME